MHMATQYDLFSFVCNAVQRVSLYIWMYIIQHKSVAYLHALDLDIPSNLESIHSGSLIMNCITTSNILKTLGGIFVCAGVCACVRVYAYVYVRMCMCVYVRACVHVCIRDATILQYINILQYLL